MAHRSGKDDAILPPCEWEPDVVRALARGELPRDLLLHTEACPVCNEIRAVTQQLNHLHECSLEEPLESAASMWWRLNLRMRRQQMNRAQLPLVWMGRICTVTLLVTAFFALIQLSLHTRVPGVLIVGLLALAVIALPTMIVLWRWSRS